MAKNLKNPNADNLLTGAYFGKTARAPQPEHKVQNDTTTEEEKAKKERRTERVQILLTPSEHDILRRLAYLNNKKYTQIIIDALKDKYEEFK